MEGQKEGKRKKRESFPSSAIHGWLWSPMITRPANQTRKMCYALSFFYLFHPPIDAAVFHLLVQFYYINDQKELVFFLTSHSALNPMLLFCQSGFESPAKKIKNQNPATNTLPNHPPAKDPGAERWRRGSANLIISIASPAALCNNNNNNNNSSSSSNTKGAFHKS